jgi:hypothetical protein
MAVDSRPRAFLCGRLVRVKESWCLEERFSQSVGDSGDTPTVGISFEVYETLAV